jgi:single-stranded DNA-binding protein
MNIHRVFFTENLIAEPGVHYTPKGTAVVNASLANNEFYTSEGGERLKLQASPGVLNTRKLGLITNPD